MHFDWLDFGRGKSLPVLEATIRRNGAFRYRTILLVDTGADGMVLPNDSARFLGFDDSDLISEEATSVGGPTKIRRPRVLGSVEMKIRRDPALQVPNLVFADCNQGLLGREILFLFFTLRMNKTSFDLEWVPGR